ncbi:MAG: tetratricopeptide repeat protein [Elusimicrobia bacterium]|nr:tetratricopeptide repeat protein [Elusimicrobiota bacterium]
MNAKRNKKGNNLRNPAGCGMIICIIFAFSQLYGENYENSVVRIAADKAMPVPYKVLCTSNGHCMKHSFQCLQTEKLKASLINLMDKVMESQDNREDYIRLNQTALMLMEEENKEINCERLSVLKKTEKIKKELDKIEKSKKSDIKNWLKLGSKLKRDFSDIDKLETNTNLYKKFLILTPLYSGMQNIFAEKNSEIKASFRSCLKKHYPFWIPEEDKLAPKDVATVVFARKSANDISDIHANTRFIQEIIKKMREIDNIELEVKNRFVDIDEMLNFYLRRRYSKAIDRANEIFQYDSKNLEAVFYYEMANNHLLATEDYQLHGAATKEQTTGTAFPTDKQTPEALPTAYAKKPNAKKQSLKKTPAQKSKFHKKKAAYPLGRSVEDAQKSAGKQAKYAEKNIKKPKPQKISAKTDLAMAKIPNVNKISAEEQKAKTIEDADSYYVLGIKYYALGNMEKALQYWEKCLKIYPEHSKAKKAIERANRESNKSK